MSQKEQFINIDNGILVIKNSEEDQDNVYDINQIIENRQILKEILYKIGQARDCIDANTLTFEDFKIKIYEDHIVFFENSNTERYYLSNLENSGDVIEFLDYLLKKLNCV